MSLYAVKNDEGKWLGCEVNEYDLGWYKHGGFIFDSEDKAKNNTERYGGHVVELVEKPKKVVLNEKEAKLIEQLGNNISDFFPAGNIADYIGENWAEYGDHNRALDEWRLIDALVNGYTVANEKKYNVKVPHTKEAWYYKSGDTDLLTICPADKKLRGKFTESEIEQYGLQDCEKEEVTDDER